MQETGEGKFNDVATKMEGNLEFVGKKELKVNLII